MGQDFYRRVIGYNLPSYNLGYASMTRDQVLTLNFPAGPGKIEKGMILCADVDIHTPLLNTTTLTIDNAVVFSYALWAIVGFYDVGSFSGPWCGRGTGTVFTTIQFLCDWDYEASGSLSIKNDASPSPSAFYINLWGRVGK